MKKEKTFRKKNPTEILRMIDKLIALKLKVIPISAFGSNNITNIDVQIDVLKNRYTEKELEDFYYSDETSEDFVESDMDTYNIAKEAWNWMYGKEKVSDLSKGWPLKKK